LDCGFDLSGDDLGVLEQSLGFFPLSAVDLVKAMGEAEACEEAFEFIQCMKISVEIW
jgi:hypothetical protein